MANKNDEERNEKRGGKIKQHDVDYERTANGGWRAILKEDESKTAEGPDRTSAYNKLRNQS